MPDPVNVPLVMVFVALLGVAALGERSPTAFGRALLGGLTLFGFVSLLNLFSLKGSRTHYMLASDGGIFAYGDARFYGSLGDRRLNAPVQSLVPDADGVGYWLVASDGGVFAFETPFRGAMGNVKLNRPVTGMVRFGDGYIMVGEGGGVFNFSDRPFSGSLGDRPPATRIAAVAAVEK